MNLENRIKRARHKANKKIMGVCNLNKRFEITSKDEVGYSAYYPYARALGFKDDDSLRLPHTYINSIVYKDRLFSAIDTLLNAGYTITIPEELAKKDLNI